MSDTKTDTKPEDEGLSRPTAVPAAHGQNPDLGASKAQPTKASKSAKSKAADDS